jgi:hypothetical protein
MFGFGMVLASGCGSKTLVRIGGGNLKSVVVFFVLGSPPTPRCAASRPWRAWPRSTASRSTCRPGQDLPSLLAHAGLGSRLPLALVAGGVMGWPWSSSALAADARSAECLLGGLGIGAVVVAVWWVSGRLGHLAEHPLTLEEPSWPPTRSAWSR